MLKFSKIIILILICYISQSLFSQTKVAKNTYFISFKDKNENLIENPNLFLSKKAIERRQKYDISIVYNDLPISQIYIDSIKNMGIKVLNKSKWLNGITIFSEDSILIESLKNIKFIENFSQETNNSESKKITPNTEKIIDYSNLPERLTNPKKVKKEKNVYNYGDSREQIEMNHGNYLHNNGFRGENMLIAITDGGFTKVNELSAFEQMRKENRILGGYNFVNQSDSIYGYGTHGTSCLSILGGFEEGKLIGAAPKANFLILISEDGKSEMPIEEYNWVSAAEFADSAGADIISVSLGYFVFDEKELNHTYNDLDGKTSAISKAATIAASKGMIVCISAGNSGRTKEPWITPPGDAENILTVGAVEYNGNIAEFSSIGYTSDGRVKPDVLAVGHLNVYQTTTGRYFKGSGTSFAAPIISGLTACLWQKFPQKNNLEIIDAIKKSSTNYFNPNNTFGYGIPDFEIASLILENDKNQIVGLSDVVVKSDFDIFLKNNINDKININIKNTKNKTVYKFSLIAGEKDIKHTVPINSLQSGVYNIELQINKEIIKKTVKIIKPF